MKIISWNVNGIRAIFKKNFTQHVKNLDPDILCLQETKANTEQVKDAVQLLNGYHVTANASKGKKGYSGTAILSKVIPISVSSDIGVDEHDQEGRVTTAEFEEFFIVNVYVPNSGNELVRLDYRKTWDSAFLAYLKKMEEKKPVIVCGDFNVAHQPIDIARPKANYNKSAGYTQVEIDGFSQFVENGLVDTFRHLYPEEVAYTWWSYRANARENNIGWRIDYFLMSKVLISRLEDAIILRDYDGSDHCPLGVILKK